MTRLLGAVLIVVGVVAYLVTGAEHITALLPALLGAPILILGLAAGARKLERPMLITAVVLALLGALGTAMNVVELPALLTGEDVERPAAVITSAITAVLCVVYVVAGIRWLLTARGGPEREGSDAPDAG